MKNRIYKIVVFAAILLCSYNALLAQQNATYNSYNGQTQLYAPGSITLTDGFYVPSGSNLRVFTGVSFQDCFALSYTPTANQNYILARTFKISGVNTTNLGTARSACEESQVIQYFDGLGRPLQTINVQASPAHKDVIQPVVYDQLGRETLKYQPYTEAGGNGNYRANALQGGQQAFYNSAGIKNTAYPFSKSLLEASPLNRVMEMGAPGEAWQPQIVGNANTGHTKKMRYGTNTSGEVAIWVPSGSGASTSANYLAGSLVKTTTTDENYLPSDGNAGKVEEFKDFEGRVVLKRQFTATETLSTYYVYDDYDNLKYVLPPAIHVSPLSLTAFNETDAAFNNFIYAYRYDDRKRVTEKKIPGKGWESMVYNTLNQVVLSQDANLKTTGRWLYTKYDVQGRVIATGLYTDGSSLSALLAAVNNQGAKWEVRPPGADYSNNAFPQNNTSVQTVNYYDDYAFPDNLWTPNGTTEVSAARTKGLLTGTKVKVIGSSDVLLSVNLYDEEAKILKTYSQHYLAGSINNANYDEVSNTYSFIGELVYSSRVHHTTAGNTTIATRYEYDHAGRKMATFENINDQGEVTLSHLAYNEIGQLKNKKLHNEIQSTDFTYNERSWLKNSSSSEFSMELKYNDAVNISPQYNGNIANQLWGAGGNLPNTYNYSYDKLNRLTGANSTGISMSEVLTYDVMGNLTSLNRDNTGANAYNYTGNRLNSINNLTGAYQYDANGNALTDGRNGMTLTYNYLNLPATANKSGTSVTYTYNAAGQKLTKNYNNTVRQYVNGIEYNGNIIDVIHTEEGLAQNNGGTYTYKYNLSDHLGNVRYTFDIYGGAVRRLQSDDYYAFGKRMSVLPASTDNKYLYNGKEVQDELGEQYDYGARFYDPIIGRWNVVDPMAEQDRKSTPYNYAFNNPILFIDPDGMFGDYYDMDGSYIGNDGKDDKKVYAVKKGDYKSIGDNKSVISKSTELKGVTNETLLAFASVIHNESGGNRTESYAIGNVTMNFIDGGGSRGVPTLEDAVMYDNRFAQGATQDNYSDFMNSSPSEQNSRGAVGAAINAIGFSQKLEGFKDFSGGANSWDGVDLIKSSSENNHRGYIWNSDSKSLLSKYKMENKGGVNVSSFAYKSSGFQISATKIIGKTLFTRLEGGRGEKNESKIRFKR